MMAAVSQGVRDSVNDLLNRDPVRGTAGEWLYLAVREGVSDAVIKIKESRVAVPSGSRRDAT